MNALLILVGMAATADVNIPDDILRSALEYEIVRRSTHIACVDVRDRSAPAQFLASIHAPAYNVVALSECTSSPDGIKSGTGQPAFDLSLDSWKRKSGTEVQVTILWFRSSAENGSEQLVLRQENGVWRVSESLGESVA